MSVSEYECDISEITKEVLEMEEEDVETILLLKS